MKTLYDYAVVRFMPFAETEEFANVGIVLWGTKPKTIEIKLAPVPFQRINSFFDDLDGKLYPQARHYMELELKRIMKYANEVGPNQLDSLMQEVTRQREGVMIFSEVGTILGDDAKTVVNKLYETYIGRDLPLSKEQREHKMVQELKRKLLQSPLQYKEKAIETGFGKIKVPLVTNIGANLRAIKPMAFNHPRAMEIADHGDKWISRVRHAIDANSIKPEDFLFTVEEPKSRKEEPQRAFEIICNSMKSLGVNVIPFKDKQKVLEFAKPDLSAAPDDFCLNN
ncbi:TPA: DUF3037 domain-containing protein [Vibrio vulnificus]